MSSYVVKEREWDTESVRSGRGHHHTNVRRYRVPEREERTERIVERIRDDDDVRSVRTSRGEGEREEIRITRRETRGDRDDDRDVVSYRVVDRRKSRSRSRSRSSSPPRRREEKITIRREVSRSPSPEPERVRERRYERVERDDRYLNRPYDLERYSKSTEYFSRPEPQTPIIIRESVPQPIIIREEAPRQEIVIRRDERSRSRSRSSSPSRAPSRVGTVVSEHRTVVNEEQAIIPLPQPPQEDYYYERTTREVAQPHHHHRRRRRHRRRESEQGTERDYNSDDSVKYVRREVKDYEVRDDSPHTKRHLAEGAVVGLGAAALMRSRSKKRGEDPGHRGRQALGYAAAGAIGAEALSRAKRHWDRDRSRSVEREVDEYYEDRNGRRHEVRHHRSKSRRRSRSRSSSSHHGKRNTVLAVAGIAAAAAAAYAAGKRGNNNNNTTVIEDRRSRSRHRAGSASGASERSLSRGPVEGVHQDPQHRNRRIAQAGLAGAALAGLAEHQRNKSRGRSRSKSRIRQAIPVVATGLGTAAVAGIYEKFKASKEAKRSQSRLRDASRGRSHSRSRSRSVGAARRAGADGALIEYGGDPIVSRDGDRSRGRSRSGSRHRSHSRHRSSSRFRDVATGAAIAGATGLAVNEAKKRREAKRAEKERRRREEEAANENQDNYYDPMQYYPAHNAFPPPPGPSPYAQNPYDPPPPLAQHPNNSFQDPANAYSAQAAPYNPANYPPQNGPTLPEHYYQGHRDVHSPTQDYYAAGGHPTPHPGDAAAPGGGHAPPPHSQNPENVSAIVPDLGDDDAAFHARDLDDGLEDPHHAIPSGASTPKNVKFDLPSASPVEERRLGHDVGSKPRRRRGSDPERYGDSERAQRRSNEHDDTSTAPGYRRSKSDDYRRRSYEDDDRRRRRRDYGDDGERHGGDAYGGRSKRDQRERPQSPASDDSGETTELPARFDEQGKRVDGSSGNEVEDGPLSKLFQSLVQNVLDGRGGGGTSRRR